MVDLKDKTVEELRKMASKKKIEGRSKMNKAELVRALKKKTSSRKMKGGMNNLPNNVQSHIKTFTNCKDIIKYFSSLNKSKLKNFDWNDLPQIPFEVSPEVNLNIDCSICRFIENENENIQRVNREKCKIYYNKCRILDLFNKYMRGRHIGSLVNIGGLKNLLLVTIPNTENMNSVRNDQEFLQRLGVVYSEISDKSFNNFNLTSVTIPNFIRTIGYYAFAFNQLITVNIPDSITFIGDGAFYKNQLTSVNIPNSVISIGIKAFQDNKLNSVTIPNSITEISEYVFQLNELTSIFIPNSVRVIGAKAFQYNRLTSVTIPDSVETIGWCAFAHNRLTSVTIPNSVTEIHLDAFANNNLLSVKIPNSVQIIGNGVFNNNPLRYVTMPTRFKENKRNIFQGMNTDSMIFTYI